MTRNHLIEHPEGASSNATKYSYSFSHEHGALLRTANDSNQKVRDKGSVLNAKEFRENFIQTVKKSYAEIYKENPDPMLRPEGI